MNNPNEENKLFEKVVEKILESDEELKILLQKWINTKIPEILKDEDISEVISSSTINRIAKAVFERILPEVLDITINNSDLTQKLDTIVCLQYGLEDVRRELRTIQSELDYVYNCTKNK